jgi:peptide/nickel transport system ATP-binding protein
VSDSGKNVLLEVSDLKKHFPITSGFLRRRTGAIRAVDGVSFTLKRGQTLSLVGESGSGKTTAGLTVLREYAPTGGKILFHGPEGVSDVGTMSKIELKAYRRHAQMVFQDPYSSMNPRMTICDIIAEPLVVQKAAKGTELKDRVAKLMSDVGLRPDHLNRYPHAFSGGQRQRIAVARALALNPELIVADEAVSALDVSVQAQILNLFQDLKEQYRLSYLFIAHDLSVVEHISDRVAVMYLGRIVETANAETLFAAPCHPYTVALLEAAPVPDPRAGNRQSAVKGEIGDPAHPPPGCPFHPRCPFAKAACREQVPELRNKGSAEDDHWVACHVA